MKPYCYVKQVYSHKKRAAAWVSYLFLTSGSLLLFWSLYPIVSYMVYENFLLVGSTVSPVPQAHANDIAPSQIQTNEAYTANVRDFIRANQWFPNKIQPVANSMSAKEYSISIPKLHIANANVTVGGDDLSKSLIHYFPTSLPGEFGNVAIFGHSTLPQLYNVADYKTIFTYLPSLERGDKIVTHLSGIDYTYEVYDMVVVKPEEISVLEPRYDASYLTLITCVPPGTYWNRLVVRAKLTSLPQ